MDRPVSQEGKAVWNKIIAMAAAITAMVCAPAMSQSLTVPVLIHKPDTVLADDFPVTFGIPFAQGQAPDPALIRISGKPTQVESVVNWPDGSVKWRTSRSRLRRGPRFMICKSDWLQPPLPRKSS